MEPLKVAVLVIAALLLAAVAGWEYREAVMCGALRNNSVENIGNMSVAVRITTADGTSRVISDFSPGDIVFVSVTACWRRLG
jgi:uncharacterized protein YunC (DUF1805 family)